MILVHKPQSMLSSPCAHHRRHPSAPPAVVVQPTRIPGLLSLSKPVKPQQQRQRSAPKMKQLATSLAKATPELEVLKPSPEIIVKSSARGRQNKTKEKPVTRSSSHSAVRGRRNNARQQSPPLPTSQAEVMHSPTYKSNNSNLFDPFLDESNVRSQLTRPASIPTLASRPSGKLARRRHPNLAPNSTIANSPTKAIPVPRRFNSSSTLNLSRSEPSVSHVRLARNAKTSRDVFPICDDLTETEDDSDDDSSPPVTPTRLRPSPRFALNFDDGPRTAPITATPSGFPFGISPSPSPASKRVRKHTRTPSEGIFAMSSDEEPMGLGGHDNELKALLGLTAKRLPLSDESEQEREALAAAAAAAYFASSNFQNSPSPEELPPPTFAFV